MEMQWMSLSMSYVVDEDIDGRSKKRRKCYECGKKSPAILPKSSQIYGKKCVRFICELRIEMVSSCVGKEFANFSPMLTKNSLKMLEIWVWSETSTPFEFSTLCISVPLLRFILTMSLITFHVSLLFFVDFFTMLS